MTKINRDQLKHIGKFKEPKGLKGELFMIVFSKDYTWLDDLHELYVEDQNGDLKFYEIEDIKKHKDAVVVKLAGIDNRNQSEVLAKLQVWVSDEVFVSEDGEALYLAEIKNFKVMDQVVGEIGLITDFSSNGVQDLLVVNRSEQPVEIPFVEAFVEKIDYENKVIYMNLPNGLLEINLITSQPDDADEN